MARSLKTKENKRARRRRRIERRDLNNPPATKRPRQKARPSLLKRLARKIADRIKASFRSRLPRRTAAFIGGLAFVLTTFLPGATQALKPADIDHEINVKQGFTHTAQEVSGMPSTDQSGAKHTIGAKRDGNEKKIPTLTSEGKKTKAKKHNHKKHKRVRITPSGVKTKVHSAQKTSTQDMPTTTSYLGTASSVFAGASLAAPYVPQVPKQIEPTAYSVTVAFDMDRHWSLNTTDDPGDGKTGYARLDATDYEKGYSWWVGVNSYILTPPEKGGKQFDTTGSSLYGGVGRMPGQDGWDVSARLGWLNDDIFSRPMIEFMDWWHEEFAGLEGGGRHSPLTSGPRILAGVEARHTHTLTKTKLGKNGQASIKVIPNVTVGTDLVAASVGGMIEYTSNNKDYDSQKPSPKAKQGDFAVYGTINGAAVAYDIVTEKSGTNFARASFEVGGKVRVFDNVDLGAHYVQDLTNPVKGSSQKQVGYVGAFLTYHF